jgi:hypothetical protein
VEKGEDGGDVVVGSRLYLEILWLDANYWMEYVIVMALVLTKSADT